MRCPFCGYLEDKVVDSRETREGDAIRRRRECLRCSRRFTSYERVEEVPMLVVKKDGRREPFDRNKLLRSLGTACQKRPVGLTRLEEIATDIQARLLERPDREISSRDVGEMVMESLKVMDSVAYVRFASVYRDFKDLPDFVKALEGLMRGEESVLLPRALPATASTPSRPTPSPVSAAPPRPSALLQAAPGLAAPGLAAPGQAAPGQAAPGQAAPGQAAPEQVNSKPSRGEPTPLFPTEGIDVSPPRRKRR